LSAFGQQRTKVGFCREKLWTLQVPEASGHSPEHPENAINVSAVIEPGVKQKPACQRADNPGHYAHSVIIAPKS
jgi:hypothetical protein